jgi:hypothetical protein
MLAGSTIDLDEIAKPEILDPRQVKGMHSGLKGVARFVNTRRPRRDRSGQV